MLRLDGISKRYGDRLVLRDVCFTAAPKSLTVISGPNGSGKSTLLHVIAGLARADAGLVTYNGPPGGIGYLGHESLAYPQLTALENLTFWASLHAIRHDEATLMSALERVYLAPYADEAAGTFSRGMAQRLSFARLLVFTPALALLDEPMTGLDEASAAIVRTEIAALRDAGAAVIQVTHDVSADGMHADAALLMQTGGGYRLAAKEALCAERRNSGSALC